MGGCCKRVRDGVLMHICNPAPRGREQGGGEKRLKTFSPSGKSSLKDCGDISDKVYSVCS